MDMELVVEVEDTMMVQRHTDLVEAQDNLLTLTVTHL
jgi:hypothetical protein